MQAKRLKLDAPPRPVTQQEVQAMRVEVAALKAGLQQMKILFNDMTGLLRELKRDRDGGSTSSDSGMSSETKKAVEDNSNKIQSTFLIEGEVKTEILLPTEKSPTRPVIPLLYGIIRHNPNKERKSAPSEVTQKEPRIAVVAPSPPIASPETFGYLHKKKRACKELAKVTENNDNNNNMVPIGTGKTSVPKSVYNKINWNSYTIATRKLLVAAFSKRTLATHSLTGKASPAFANKPAKLCLDPKKILDIIIEVTAKCKVKENLVRNAITTKCADEYKMMRMQAKKQNTTV